MPYVIRVFDRAIEVDLTQLLGDVVPDRWDAIGAAIEAILAQFSAIPTVTRPTEMIIPLHFTVQGTQYRWIASWQYGEDEQTIQITAFGRDPKTVL